MLSLMHIQRIAIQLASIVCLLPAGPAISNPNETLGTMFYQRNAEGYFWHDDPLIPEDPEELDPSPIEVQAQEASEPPTKPGPEPGSSEWLRVTLPKLLDMAIDHPTPENITAYRTAQRVALDKASRFEDAFRTSAAMIPELDENRRMPISTFGEQAAIQTSNEGKRKILRDLSKTTELWFFYSSTCQYCIRQAPSLVAFSHQYDMRIRAISLDGGMLQNAEFQTVVQDQGQAQMLGVTSTPTIFIVRPPDQYVVVSEGILSNSQLAERLLLIAHEYEWISPQDFQETQPVRNQLLAEKDILDLNEIDWSNPDASLSALRNALRAK